MHDLASHLVCVVPQQMINQASFVASKRRLAYLSQQQLTVPEKHPSVSDAPVLPSGVNLLLRTKVNDHSRQTIGSEHSTDDLFPSPQNSRL